jgi:ATP-binding cassette subfamily B protein
VRFSDVSFAYEPGAPTLTDVSLDVPAGLDARRWSARPAPGKTTLGYLLARLYDVDSGLDHHRRRDVRDLSLADAVRRRSASSPRIRTCCTRRSQRTSVSPAPTPTDDELVEAARAARIHDLIASLPEGYDTGGRGAWIPVLRRREAAARDRPRPCCAIRR